MDPNNPVLDEIDQHLNTMTPPARGAIVGAMSRLQPPTDSMAGMSGPGAGVGQPATPQAPAGPVLKAPGPQVPKLSMPTQAPAAPTSPQLTGDQAELSRLRSTGSGVSQIKNPFLRGLGVAGDVAASFFPRAAMSIPGTTAHHNYLVGQQQSAVNSDEAAITDQANQQKEGAITNEANARADALRNPPPKEDKEEGKTITTDQGIMQWNPETKKYDIPAGKTPNKPDKYSYQQTDQGLMRIDSDSGAAQPVMFNGQPLKTKPSDKTEDEFHQYADEYRKANPRATFRDVVKQYAADHEAPQRAPQVMVMVPNAQGGSTAEVLHPGQSVAPGSTTTSGFNSETVAKDKTVATAKKAQDDATKDYQLVQTLAANPSPTNDLAIVMHYIGATKPDSLGKLRLNNNEVGLVLHTRSSLGDLDALANKISNGQMLTSDQRKDMLNTMRILTGQGSPDASSGGGSVKYKVGDRTYTIPKEKESDFLNDNKGAKKL